MHSEGRYRYGISLREYKGTQAQIKNEQIQQHNRSYDKESNQIQLLQSVSTVVSHIIYEHIRICF